MASKHRKFQRPKPRPAQAEVMPTVNLSLLDAAVVRLPEFDSVEVCLAGCGGTGSFVAMHAGRLLYALNQLGKRTHLTLVDPDTVEERNVGRQLFCDAEIGVPKAAALARRYGFAWGLETSYVVDKFDAKFLHDSELTVVVGCVDGAEGRIAINEALRRNEEALPFPPPVCWLDCGNVKRSGRVLLGSAYSFTALAGAFPEERVCASLPSPALQSRGLLKPQPEEIEGHNLSCAELLAANQQAFDINASVAVEASKFLTGLLLTRDLKCFQAEINVTSGVVRSTYTTPEEVARVTGKPVSYLLKGRKETAA